MGRRRKKYKKVIKKIRKVPKIFQCPNCGSRTLTIKFEKLNIQGYKKAVITCGTCGLYAEMQVPELYEPVDVYAKFVDLFEEGEIEVQFKKHEEERGEVIGEST